MDDKDVAEKACRYVKKNKKEIIDRFAGDIFPSVEQPISLFMAGSPGAGKTEFSTHLVKELGEPIVRIDGDALREMLPGYAGKNSSIFQGAISVGVDKIHDYVLDKSKSFILDGTFTHFDRSKKNIERSLKENRPVIIVYVYQDPLIAWEFTKRRKEQEGRDIPKDIFIEQYFTAREVVQKMKDEFGSKIRVWLIEKDLTNPEKFEIHLNIEKIDGYINMPYSKKDLERLLAI